MFNYFKSVLRYIANLLREVDQTTYLERLVICKGSETVAKCDYYEDNHCTLCGCRCEGPNGFLSKLRMPHESCPIGKWGAVVPDETLNEIKEKLKELPEEQRKMILEELKRLGVN